MASEALNMVQFTQGTAAATAVLGYDIMSGGNASRHKTAAYPRKIFGLGVAGSAAAGDSAVDLYVGTVNVGTFPNTTGGASKIPTANVDMQPLNIPVPPGAPISLIVSDAALTEILNVTLVLAP